MERIRGVWLANVGSRVLHSREAIARAMDLLAQTGFNAVFPVVWNKGFTLYPSRIMLELFGIEIDPLYAEAQRDPLAEVIEEARRAGIRMVIPWFEYGFASSPRADGGHLLLTRPAWTARVSGGAPLVKNGLVWMNAFDPEVQNFVLSLMLEVAANYQIAGVQGDDRLPALPVEGGYDPYTIGLFREATGSDPPGWASEPGWVQWRADRLTEFLGSLYTQIKSVRPDLLLSLAPSVYPFSLNHYLQDVAEWARRGWFDLLHPQVYRENFGKYRREIDRLKRDFPPEVAGRIAPGIAFKANGVEIGVEDLRRRIALNRERGLGGEVFFYFDGLRTNDGRMAQAFRDWM
ncbi:glycoside hydrolase family 10 protein [Gloeobacter morelensis]|uniref:Family 10 glycosylhydrolase n=1 Tax=Gloeobacter morelensis MG652769 TaxID=2781736 RepID=A0ABY3PR85_9CYAN|nr:family 10 glycosylhydrolase [Gloeobacter morelensis]UFP96223.1 family 10 glycosylhydrolase [Gloeobacter morelensis MG652769]